MLRDDEVGERVAVVGSLEASLLGEGRCGVATLIMGEEVMDLLDEEERFQCSHRGRLQYRY